MPVPFAPARRTAAHVRVARRRRTAVGLRTALPHRRLRRQAPAPAPHAHAPCGGGDAQDGGGQADGQVQGAHGATSGA
ncbi:hypothetical protein ACL02U_02010 [Streptomyces sp. MS06]